MKYFAALILLLFTIYNISAQNQDSPYTGWLETETEHFKIIYEPISSKSVIEITEFCEDVYKSVTTFFDSYPEKIILVIHDRIDASNGSFYPTPPHINMYVSSPPIPEFGAKVDNWLRFLLTHELTHYVNMTIEKGLFYQLSRVLGESVSSIPGGLMPGWAIEGIAVKLESDLTGGGRGNNPFFEMYSKALILENKLFSWRQAAYSSYHPPLSRIYIGGFLINDYMSRKYGNDIFVRIYKDYLNFPLLGFNHYVKKITGDSISVIFEKIELELKEKYSNSNSSLNKLFSPDLESNYYLPVITEKGWILYRDSTDKEPAIILLDPESKKETVLIKTTLSDYSSFSASTDGNTIFFTALDINGKHSAGLSVVSDLYVFNRTTGKIKRITSNAHIRQPAVSQNGNRLIAVQKNGQYTKLVDINIDTGLINEVFKEENTYVFSPCFSADGKQIVFTVQKDQSRNLYLLDSNNNLRTFDTKITGDVYNPTFIENGNIVFVSDIDGTPDLYEIDMLNEGKITKILTDQVGIYKGTVSNNKIIYSTYTSNGYTLKTAPYTNYKIVHNRNNNFLTPSTFFETYKPETNNVPEQSRTISNSNKYIDLPKLVAYTPLPLYINPLYDSQQIFGPGITAYFRSILGKSELFTTLTLDTTIMQPGGSIDFSYNWGPIGLNYSLLQGYSESLNLYNALQTTEQQLIFNIPVVNSSQLGKYTYFGLFTGILDNYTILSSKDFPFFSPASDSILHYENKAYHISGAAYSLSGQKSRGDTFQPFNISSSIFLYTPVSSNFFKQFAVKNINSVNIPSPIDHHVFKLSGRFTYSEISNLHYLNNPRGFSISSDSKFNILTSAEYLFTAAKPDWPIFGGLSLQGISGTVHVEKIITLENEKLVPDKNFYGGMELIFLGNYINAFESAGIGVSYKFQPDISTFKPENLGIYIFIGTNSFK